MDQNSLHFATAQKITCAFQRHCPIVCAMFCSEDIRIKSRSCQKLYDCTKFLAPNFFRRDDPTLSGRLLAQFSVHCLPLYKSDRRWGELCGYEFSNNACGMRQRSLISVDSRVALYSTSIHNGNWQQYQPSIPRRRRDN